MDDFNRSHIRPPSTGLSELDERLDSFRRSDEERERLLIDLIKAYRILESEAKNARDDLHNEISSRRQYQAKVREMEDTLSIAQKAQDASPYVAVLIDGDGAPFLDELYAKSQAGGSDAAHRLHEQLQSHVAKLNPDSNTSTWQIVVHIFLSMDGLSSKLRACGLLPNGDLSSFGQAFGVTQPLFQFVDVGTGKERADYKLREWFRLSLGNVQCKQIILGGICHDNGYLPMLEPHKHNASAVKRIALLATLPAQQQYKDMTFKPIRMPTVFRSEHLPTKPTMSSLPLQSASSLRPVRSESRDILNPPVSGSDFTSLARTSSPATSATTNGISSWANVSKTDGDHKEFNVVTAKKAKQKFILYNKSDERLDVKITGADQLGKDKLVRRINESGKLCNIYHLSGKCPGGCGFAHGEKLDQAEQAALRARARTRACINGSRCQDIDCTFGHVCPYGNTCRGAGCYFEDLHGIDMVPAYKWFEDDRIELVNQQAA